MREIRSVALAAAAVAALAGGCARAPERCNSDFAQPLQAHPTLTRRCSPYTLNSHLTVDGWELTLEPGVELRFGEGAGLEVGAHANSRLTARGTAQAPIRLVSAGRQEPGFWDGVTLGPHAARSALEHVVIENAGHGGRPALRVDADGVALRALRMIGVPKVAIALGEPDRARLEAFAENDFTEAGSPVDGIVQLDFRSLPAIAPDNRFARGAVIELAGSIGESVTFLDPGVPYRIRHTVDVQGTAQGSAAHVTLQPGVILQMGEGTAINFGYAGPAQLTAVGTADKPIVFTRFGADVADGSWKGLTFHAHVKPPTLAHVRIEYAGDSDHAALRYAGARRLGRVTHCTFSHGAGAGVWADEAETPFEEFSGNTFEDLSGAALHLPTPAAHGLGGDNHYPANASIEVSGDLHRDATLTNQGAPYVVQGRVAVEAGASGGTATLTVEPGTRIRFTQGSQLSFGKRGSGQLRIRAPADKPVLFTAHGDDWQGLEFGERARVEVENLVIEKVDAGHAALTFHDGASGSLQGVTVRRAKRAVQNCSTKLTVRGLQAEGAGGDVKEGCP